MDAAPVLKRKGAEEAAPWVDVDGLPATKIRRLVRDSIPLALSPFSHSSGVDVVADACDCAWGCSRRTRRCRLWGPPRVCRRSRVSGWRMRA